MLLAMIHQIIRWLRLGSVSPINWSDRIGVSPVCPIGRMDRAICDCVQSNDWCRLTFCTGRSDQSWVGQSNRIRAPIGPHFPHNVGLTDWISDQYFFSTWRICMRPFAELCILWELPGGLNCLFSRTETMNLGAKIKLNRMSVAEFYKSIALLVSDHW
jgi:hypothetical protein